LRFRESRTKRIDMDNQQANIERFNAIAGEWDEKPERVEMASAIAASMRQALALDGTEWALEFGCGTGLVTLRLAPHLAQLIAMDSSREMLAVLRQKCASQGQGNVILREGSVPGQLPDQTFDVVFSSMTLHHVEDIADLLRALHRRLEPDGRIALADLDAEDGSFHGDKPGIAHLGFERDAFEQQLRGAGFEKVQFANAHRIRKEDAAGNLCEYPVFLVVATAAQC
jgi:ubiquinone/menaquinone biosynthesis C-methylase UbiE